MATDFLLLQRYPRATPRFRHYGWRGPAFTFGYSQKIAFVRESLASAAVEPPFELCRRATGGGVVDVYRKLKPTTTDEAYTWWSNRGQAWANNVGWRIDYHIATAGIAKKAKTAAIYKTARFSDHSPLTIDYK
eukprot:gene44051-53854_t